MDAKKQAIKRMDILKAAWKKGEIKRFPFADIIMGIDVAMGPDNIKLFAEEGLNYNEFKENYSETDVRCLQQMIILKRWIEDNFEKKK